MHCDVKKFQYSGEQKTSICSVEITASVYGTAMTINFPFGKKEEIVEALSKAEIPIESVGSINLSIKTPLHATANIKKSLEILSSNGLISHDFAKEIVTNYPNGHGGKMDLNNPSKGLNALLMLAASSIFKLNAQLEEESRQDKQDTIVDSNQSYAVNAASEFDLATQQKAQSTPLQQSLLRGFVGFWQPPEVINKEKESNQVVSCYNALNTFKL